MASQAPASLTNSRAEEIRDSGFDPVALSTARDKEALQGCGRPSNPPRTINIGNLKEEELLVMIQGYIISMSEFAERTRNVHKELKDTLKHTGMVMKQYVKVKSTGRNTIATTNINTQMKDASSQADIVTKNMKWSNDTSKPDEAVHQEPEFLGAMTELKEMIKTQNAVIAELAEKVTAIGETQKEQQLQKQQPWQQVQRQRQQQYHQQRPEQQQPNRSDQQQQEQEQEQQSQPPDGQGFKEVKSRRKNRNPRTRPDVIIVKNKVTSYSDMLKRIKAGTGVQALSKSIHAVTAMKEGHLRIVIDRQTTDTKNLTEAISSVIGEDTICTRLTDSVKLEIMDVDDEASSEEITQAITSATGTQTDTKILSIKKTGRGTQIVTVVIPAAAANALTPRLRIGYVNCRVRRPIEVKKCHRCQGYGHTRNNCDAPDRSNACWKCGGQGHKNRECSEKPKCLLCKEEATDEHIMGSFRCHAFRRAFDIAKQSK